ncbi:phytase [Glaciecola petra]|uniref:Phytase n=1 Tax=Glaciecola petra TaxID=3075602 RepID=A0ABU2ZUB1_9ALTE|nr:phytase [Aestuariibacter sp. P117]MDT0595174.1 phytase [Aestuariibacter sp. P117]
MHMYFTKRSLGNFFLISTAVATLGCSESVDRNKIEYADTANVLAYPAKVETTPVVSSDDAADDPTIWIHPNDKSKSLIVGTDKQKGLGVYDLQGQLVQFVEHGRPNNVDLRQRVSLDGESVDLVAFSDRSDNTVGLATIDESGITIVGSFGVKEEPYGFCLGQHTDQLFAIVTYKDGLLEQYKFGEYIKDTPSLVFSYQFDSQLEGCVMDDTNGRLFVGEENHGVWALNPSTGQVDLVDVIDGQNGIVADVEGMDIYHARAGNSGLLFVSSQGNDSFATYALEPPYRFVDRFRVNATDAIDGAQETDGLAVTSTPLPGFPSGLLVVQDGFNDDGMQNFKYVDARTK